jgi:hypothetical protein|tara:strand:- start:737 stop:1159 length:423 start_codon:yes stop_codon:yes gene_type:complete
MKKFLESMFGKFLRWLAIIPGAFLALILVPLLINLILLNAGPYGTDETFLSSIFRPLFVSGIGSLAFVYIGSYIAPLYKRVVSILLCIILISLYLLLILGIIKYDLLWTDGTFQGWLFIAGIIALLGGSICGVVVVWEEN